MADYLVDGRPPVLVDGITFHPDLVGNGSPPACGHWLWTSRVSLVSPEIFPVSNRGEFLDLWTGLDGCVRDYILEPGLGRFAGNYRGWMVRG